MQEIYAAYKAHGDRIAKEERLIEMHKKRLNKLESTGGWIEHVLRPLSDRISKRLGGMPYEIYGPFGLGCETSVYFFASGKIGDICKDETYGITVHPQSRDGFGTWEERFYLTYNTGETCNNYQPGTIGYLNGFNNVEAPLPDDLDEIMEIVKRNHDHYQPEEE